MDTNGFNLPKLIASMKDLRHMQLGDQVRQALEGAALGFDPAVMAELVRELESDIEEHIERLEKISAVMTDAERAHPEHMDQARRSEVAFQSGFDLEEVDSLCEAFARARELLSGAEGGGMVDLKLLFSNLRGLDLNGPDGVPKVPSQVLEELLGGKLPLIRQQAPQAKDGSGEISLEEMFDLEKPFTPRNRLPKDWKP